MWAFVHLLKYGGVYEETVLMKRFLDHPDRVYTANMTAFRTFCLSTIELSKKHQQNMINLSCGNRR
jgi:hypothetical protein